jgi:Uma2 family endonuclease
VWVAASPSGYDGDDLPGPTDLILVAAISDSSLGKDTTTKAASYARAGIPEYWVLDLAGQQIIVHRLPGATGYAEVTVVGTGELLMAPGREASARVEELLATLSAHERALLSPPDA